MTTLFLTVLAAASLATAGNGAPGETRSAQSLPHEQLAVASPNAAATGKLHPVNRLAAAAPDGAGSGASDKASCQRRFGRWDDQKLRCRRVIAWPVPVIGAATSAGLGYALAANGDQNGTSSISH